MKIRGLILHFFLKYIFFQCFFIFYKTVTLRTHNPTQTHQPRTNSSNPANQERNQQTLRPKYKPIELRMNPATLYPKSTQSQPQLKSAQIHNTNQHKPNSTNLQTYPNHISKPQPKFPKGKKRGPNLFFFFFFFLFLF